MSDEKKFHEAKQFFLEHNGNALVTNTYLKVALLVLSAVIGGLTYALVGATGQLAHLKPLVIRIDQVGKAEAVRYDNFKYTPQEPEVKYFLAHFCRLFYGRSRYTLRDNFSQALYFLDAAVGRTIVESYTKNKTLESYLQTPNTPDVQVDIRQITIEELGKPPYKARVEYTLVYRSATDQAVIKKDFYTAQFVFLFKDKIANEDIQINPLGLAIAYFRSDQAFITSTGGS